MTGREGLRVRVERRATTVLVRLAGDFEWCTVGSVEAALEDARGAATEHIIFDLRQVAFLDMAGLATLIRAHERAGGNGCHVRVVRPTGRARRVFTLTRVGAVLNLVDDADDPPQASGVPRLAKAT